MKYINNELFNFLKELPQGEWTIISSIHNEPKVMEGYRIINSNGINLVRVEVNSSGQLKQCFPLPEKLSPKNTLIVFSAERKSKEIKDA